MCVFNIINMHNKLINYEYNYKPVDRRLSLSLSAVKRNKSKAIKACEQ